jgi:hypothetical protein
MSVKVIPTGARLRWFRVRLGLFKLWLGCSLIKLGERISGIEVTGMKG